MSYSALIEEVILKTGNCGIYQYITSAIVHAGKVLPVWNYHFMTFAGQTPDITCVNVKENDNSGGNFSRITKEDICSKNVSTGCETVIYDENMLTIVSEWDLICDRTWIPTFTFTILLLGSCIGSVLSGPIADKYGRKPVYCTSILLLVLFSGLSALSTSWKMYAVFQFLTGLAIEGYLNAGISLSVEFTPTSWRAVNVLIPSWPITASLFALAAWWLHDWRKLHLLTAVIGIPFLATWCLFQESIRWMTKKQHIKDVERAVGIIATINKTDKPDLSELFIASRKNTTDVDSSSVLDIFRDKTLRKVTIGVWIIWFGNYFAYFGMAFGVKSIVGDLYTNMFLLNIAEAPIGLLSPWLVNRFGRKKTASLAFLTSGLCATAVGLFKYCELGVNDEVIRIIGILAKLCTGLCCEVMIVYTLELYPTVVRTTALGFHIFASDVATIITPLVIRMDESVKGSLHFVSGALLVVSAVIILFLWETKGLHLEESIRVKEDNHVTDRNYRSME